MKKGDLVRTDWINRVSLPEIKSGVIGVFMGTQDFGDADLIYVVKSHGDFSRHFEGTFYESSKTAWRTKKL